MSAALLGRALGRELGRAALHGGSALWGLGLSHRPNEVQRLSLNGVELFVRTATVDAPLEQVLAEAHHSCATRGVGLSPALHSLIGFDGVVDERTEQEGTVACFEGAGLGDLTDLARSLEEASASADLGRLGRLRYFYARKASDARTAVLSLWTEETLPLNRLFPSEGDAPGVDDPDLPRPTGARRVLSVSHPAAERPLVVYRTEESPPRLAQTYAEELRRAGLAVTLPPAQGRTEREIRVREQLWTVRSAEHTRFVAVVPQGTATWLVSAPLP